MNTYDSILNQLGLNLDNVIHVNIHISSSGSYNLIYCDENNNVYVEYLYIKYNRIISGPKNNRNISHKYTYKLYDNEYNIINEIELEYESNINIKKMIQYIADIADSNFIKLYNQYNKEFAISEVSWTKVHIENYNITLEKLINIYKQANFNITDGSINDYISKPKVDIFRSSDNKNIDTFDFINLSLCIHVPAVYKSTMDKKDVVYKYRKELDNVAINAISNDKNFKRYNVPVNILKLDKLILTRTGELVYTFSIKGGR